MYKLNRQLTFEDFVFPYGKLSPNNEWVKLAGIIPWDKVEEQYAAKFVNDGHPAHPARMAFGSLVIKQMLDCSDAWTVRHIRENPYMQYFIGLKEYSEECPFGESTMVAFRKRFGEDVLAEVNELIIGEKDDDSDDSGGSDGDRDENEGTLILDATCTPSDITFPQDLDLLNEAREKLEAIMDELHEQVGGEKPRNYRKKARKDYLKVSKSKKKTAPQIRKALRKQLGYVYRDIMIVAGMVRAGAHLTVRQGYLLNTITTLYEQQLTMYENKINKIPDRIVSISQPWVRPIVRGKKKVKTEFGAKLHLSLAGGYARVEELSFDAYNEAEDFIAAVERFRTRTGHYPKKILADKLYRNRDNLNYCTEHHIEITGPRLGRPPKDYRPDKKREYADICERNTIEGRFGTGKQSYGLARIKARLEETSKTVIHLAVIVLNLRKKLAELLRLFFRFDRIMIFVLLLVSQPALLTEK